jgi:hypothetical protein
MTLLFSAGTEAIRDGGKFNAPPDRKLDVLPDQKVGIPWGTWASSEERLRPTRAKTVSTHVRLAVDVNVCFGSHAFTSCHPDYEELHLV